MHARVRLYLTADKSRLVEGASHPEAAFLYAAEGDEIPQSAAERFGIVDGRLQPAPSLETLLGSSILPAMVVITNTLSVQLGDVVRAAHVASGLSVDDWNALPDEDREAKLQVALEAMRSEHAPKAEAEPEPKSETQPEPKAESEPTSKAEGKPARKGKAG